MKTRRRWPLPVTALLLALGAAMVVLPARWLLLAMPTGSPVTVVDAYGTVWNGRAQLAIGPPGMRRTLPQPVVWHWHWAQGIGPAAQVEHPWLAAPLQIAPGWGGARLGQGKLTMPADTLAALGAPLNTLEPGGQLMLTWPALDLGNLPRGNVLQLTWTRASSSRVRVQPLGDYQAVLTSDGANGPSLTIQTLRGPLRVEGNGSGKGGRWRFDGQASAAPDTDDATRQALEPLLDSIGTYRNDVSHLRFP